MRQPFKKNRGDELADRLQEAELQRIPERDILETPIPPTPELREWLIENLSDRVVEKVKARRNQ